MTYIGCLRLVVALIQQAIEDARHPVVWDYRSIDRPRLQELLRQEALDWLRTSTLIDTAAHTWGIDRNEFIRRIANAYPSRTNH